MPIEWSVSDCRERLLSQSAPFCEAREIPSRLLKVRVEVGTLTE